MSTPLAATFRIVTEYSINGVTHVIHAYCNVIDPTVTTPVLLARPGGANVDWDQAAQDTWDQQRNLFQDTATGGVSAHLDERSGTVWNPIAFATLTGGGASSATTKPAQQITYVLRDTGHRKIRYVLLETVQNYVGHTSSGLGLGTAQDNFTKVLNGTTGGDGLPFNWQKSRGDSYFAVTGTVAGLTFDLNDKLKRTRHLE